MRTSLLVVLSRFTVDASTDCWLWTGPLDAKGYAKASMNGCKSAHRMMYEAPATTQRSRPTTNRTASRNHLTRRQDNPGTRPDTMKSANATLAAMDRASEAGVYPTEHTRPLGVPTDVGREHSWPHRSDRSTAFQMHRGYIVTRAINRVTGLDVWSARGAYHATIDAARAAVDAWLDAIDAPRSA